MTFKLRPYQSETIAKILDSMRQGNLKPMANCTGSSQAGRGTKPKIAAGPNERSKK